MGAGWLVLLAFLAALLLLLLAIPILIRLLLLLLAGLLFLIAVGHFPSPPKYRGHAVMSRHDINPPRTPDVPSPRRPVAFRGRGLIGPVNHSIHVIRFFTRQCARSEEHTSELQSLMRI